MRSWLKCLRSLFIGPRPAMPTAEASVDGDCTHGIDADTELAGDVAHLSACLIGTSDPPALALGQDIRALDHCPHVRPSPNSERGTARGVNSTVPTLLPSQAKTRRKPAKLLPSAIACQVTTMANASASATSASSPTMTAWRFIRVL